MLDNRMVSDMFVMLSGLNRAKAHEHAFLCKLAADEIYINLIYKSCAGDNMRGLCNAAGALAFYRFMLNTSAGENFSSARLGDITINQKNDERVEKAALVRDEYMRPVAHLLKANDFLFTSTGPQNLQKDDCDCDEKGWWR